MSFGHFWILIIFKNYIKMEKFFDFEEAINCLKNDIPVSRIGNDGKKRSYYINEDGNYICKVGNTEYVLPYNEVLTAKNWTYETDNQ